MAFSGSVKNDGTVSVKNPSVAIFGLNTVGRPLFVSEKLELTTVSAGSSWPFQTSPGFEEKYTAFAAYPKVSD